MRLRSPEPLRKLLDRPEHPFSLIILAHWCVTICVSPPCFHQIGTAPNVRGETMENDAAAAKYESRIEFWLRGSEFLRIDRARLADTFATH